MMRVARARLLGLWSPPPAAQRAQVHRASTSKTPTINQVITGKPNSSYRPVFARSHCLRPHPRPPARPRPSVLYYTEVVLDSFIYIHDLISSTSRNAHMRIQCVPLVLWLCRWKFEAFKNVQPRHVVCFGNSIKLNPLEHANFLLLIQFFFLKEIRSVFILDAIWTWDHPKVSVARTSSALGVVPRGGGGGGSGVACV